MLLASLPVVLVVCACLSTTYSTIIKVKFVNNPLQLLKDHYKKAITEVLLHRKTGKNEKQVFH